MNNFIKLGFILCFIVSFILLIRHTNNEEFGANCYCNRENMKSIRNKKNKNFQNLINEINNFNAVNNVRTNLFGKEVYVYYKPALLYLEKRIDEYNSTYINYVNTLKEFKNLQLLNDNLNTKLNFINNRQQQNNHELNVINRNYNILS
jgi:hypothetical protein